MSQTKIESLTPEQEALIPAYRQKWTAIALSTQAIDRQQASKVIRSIYTTIGKIAQSNSVLTVRIASTPRENLRFSSLTDTSCTPITA
jgi:hypothetical protein